MADKTELIKELRALTQAGMKDCQDALVESNFDLEKSVDIIKTKGLNIVSARQGRIASEGRIGLLIDQDKTGVMVEVNCETDFVSNGESFQDFTKSVTEAILHSASNNEMFTVEMVEGSRQLRVTSTKENIVVRRWWVEQAAHSNAKVFGYLHPNAKIGVLLTLLTSSAEAFNHQLFNELGNDLTMQIAAMNPLGVNPNRLNSEDVARQRAIFEAQLKELNKPQASWDKILSGKFNKWHSEVCLMEQESIVVPKISIKQVIKDVETKLKTEISIVNFIRCEVGEGLSDSGKKLSFAEEVSLLSGV